ncbi:hypothetical protein B0H11DRAFT_2216349 [Mycena galericulata]|nr:hypothetical protein B0H11DRAFT_2216349 [Mycena galericulata]
MPLPLIAPITPETIQLGEDLLAFKVPRDSSPPQLYFVGCFALLFFDYFLTLADEVEYMWKGKKTGMFYLFLMNRYCPMAFCMITLFAYFSPLWSFAVCIAHFPSCYMALTSESLRCISCNRFAIVEWLQTLLIVVPAEVVLLLRVFALTNRNKYLLGLLVSLVLLECVIVIYAMSRPGNNALVLPNVPLDSFHVCLLYSNPKMDTAYLSTSIAFDCIAFAVTMARTVKSNSSRSPSPILQTIRWDGTLYFCVILSGNVVWMALARNARPGLKFMNAQPSMYLTSIMINRLTLSVRKVATEAKDQTTAIEWPSGIFSRSGRNLSTFAAA